MTRALACVALLLTIYQPCPPGHWWRTCVLVSGTAVREPYVVCLCDNDFMPVDAYMRGWLPFIGAR